MKYFFIFMITSFCLMEASNAQPPSSPHTAMEVIELIKENIKPHWFDTRTDTIIIGNGFDTVKGIATCMFVDMNILKQAVAEHCNLIITHEPTFYDANDKTQGFMKDDKVLKEKIDYIQEHKLIIFRLHDNSHRNNPDQIMQGLADELGWNVVNHSPWILDVKKQKLSVLADSLKNHFNLQGIRIIGDPDLEISKVALVPGLAPTLQMHLAPLQRDDVDALLVGEAREWEDYVYVKDAVEQGKKKAAIFIGHMRSEEPGMKYCADWLQTFVKGVYITFLKDENFWWTP